MEQLQKSNGGQPRSSMQNRTGSLASETPLVLCYLRTIKNYGWQIGAFVALGLAAAYLISVRVQPLYEAVATLEVDRNMPLGVVGEQAASRGHGADDDVHMATQLKLIQSDSVLRPIAEKYGLVVRGSEGQISSATGLIELKQLKVTRAPNTRLVHIRYRSSDATLAAEVANAIAQSYLEHSYSLKLQSSASMSRYVERQLQELKAKMDQSSLALARYERELNLVNPEEKTSLVSARLLQLNTEYTQAQSERFKREAAFNMAKSDNLDVAQASSISESLRKLVERRDEAREKFSQVKEHYGVEHPEFRRQSAQMLELDRQVEASKQSIAKRLEALYKEAIDRETMVAKSLQDTKHESDRLNAKSFDYLRLKGEAESDKLLYEQLGQRAKEATVNASFRGDAIRIADPARPPQIPVSPHLKLNLAAGFLLCFAVAACAAIAREGLDGSVRNGSQARSAFDLAVLGSLPLVRIKRKKRIGNRQPLLLNSATETQIDPLAIAQRDGSNVYAEAIRSLHNSMMLQACVTRMRTILVTSAVPGEGKSTTAAHLAMVNALKGRRTLLIDADLRRPNLHRIFDITNSAGLADFLTEGLAWRPTLSKHSVVKELDILAAGPATSSSLELIDDRICALLEQAAQEYDLVVVDSPPLLGCPETLPLSAAVDGVVLVVAAGTTNRRIVQTTLGALSSARANVLGLALNRVAPGDCELSQYSNYYAYLSQSRT